MNKLDYEEFYDYTWNEYISDRAVSDQFIEQNKELVEAVTYDTYHVYKSMKNASETVFSKILEQTFRSIEKIGVKSKKDNIVNDAYDI